MLPKQAKRARLNLYAAIFAAVAMLVVIGAPARTSRASPNTKVAALDFANASTSVAQVDAGSVCSANVSGSWSGSIAFQTIDSDGRTRLADAQSDGGASVAKATNGNGIFVWHVPAARACAVAMRTYHGGRAIVALASAGGIAATGSSPVDPPSYVTWYNTASPWPSPITSAYVGIGGALGAANVYNTATNGFGASGLGMLGTSACFFLCYGAPGVASSNVIAAGNDVSSGNSFTTLGAPDDCSASDPPSPPPCPGGIRDQVFSIEGYASPTATPTVLVAVDQNANFAVFGGIYAAGPVVAGAGVGSPAPFPTPSVGSLVSLTGLLPSRGDILLGSAGTGNYVKCDYGETSPSMFTCNQPLVASNGFTSSLAITLGAVGSGYTLDCLVTFAGGCALLTNGQQQSLLLGESASNLSEGGFLFNGPTDINLSSGAYASSGSFYATATQAAIVQVTNNGNGVIFYYNSGLTPSPSVTFSPAPAAGINASDTVWASGGVQPNSATAGGSGGYAPEAFPVGVATQHPQFLTGTCSVTTPSSTCTFPNSFAFADTTYNCTISAQGSLAASSSYVRTSTTAIVVYSSANSTYSYACMR